MFAASFMGCDYYLGIALLSLSTGFLGFCVPGYMANIIDIAPRFAGSSMGFINMMGNVAGIVAPLVVGVLTNEDVSKSFVQLFTL
jgi:MFS family permease